MPAGLRVFRERMGYYDRAVAAKSKTAALRALGATEAIFKL